MERRIRYGIFLLLFLIGGLSIYGFFFRSASDPMVVVNADVHIRARDLADAFDSQEAVSDSLYLDKVLSVTGVVKMIRKDHLSGNYTVFLGDRSPAATTTLVNCTLDSRYNHQPVPFRIGDSLTLRGACANHLTDVILLQCIIEKQ
jgi:hypothetical protein